MQKCLIICNQCKEERTVHPSIIGSVPHEWFRITRGSHLVMPDMHFCTIECLMRWAVDEKIKINREEQSDSVVNQVGIAGEDLRRGFVHQGPDGLIYQARAERIVHD